MANVLPPKNLREVQKQFFARFLIIGSLVCGGAALVAILSILPTFISLRIARAALAVPENVATIVSDQAIALETQNRLSALASLAHATSSPVASLARVLENKPASISITSLTYTQGGTGKLILSGKSPQRQTLNSFRESVQKEEGFSSVDVPVAALVGAQDGAFTMTIVGDF